MCLFMKGGSCGSVLAVEHWYNFVLARTGERRVAHARLLAGDEIILIFDILIFVIIASQQSVCAPSPLCFL